MEGKKLTPVAIYPEGSTTNGDYLISFKNGAFISCLPVQPMITYNHSHVLTIDGHLSMFMNLCKSPFNTLTFRLFPVFEPNEYFWKTHWEPVKDKVKKHQVYADTIREIMINNSKLKDGNKWKMEDRFEWMAIHNEISRDKLKME